MGSPRYACSTQPTFITPCGPALANTFIGPGRRYDVEATLRSGRSRPPTLQQRDLQVRRGDLRLRSGRSRPPTLKLDVATFPGRPVRARRGRSRPPTLQRLLDHRDNRAPADSQRPSRPPTLQLGDAARRAAAPALAAAAPGRPRRSSSAVMVCAPEPTLVAAVPGRPRCSTAQGPIPFSMAPPRSGRSRPPTFAARRGLSPWAFQWAQLLLVTSTCRHWVVVAYGNRPHVTSRACSIPRMGAAC